MNSYRNIESYLTHNHLSRHEVVEGIADAALTLLLFVDERVVDKCSNLQVRDIMKLSEPLHHLFGIMTEVNESINPQKPENE